MNPPLELNSYVWQGAPSSSEAYSLTESLLEFPKGTLWVLESALKLGLPRKMPWHLGSLKSSKEPFLCAAQYYKRGVLVYDKDHASLTKPPVEKTKICFFSYEDLMELLEKENYFLVLDENVLNAWPQIKKQNKASYVLKEPTELAKDLSTLGSIFQSYKKQAKNLKILALGGGLTLDVASFCAHLLKVSTTLVPSTFLSMVDASLGGKNGVNFWPYGKNLVGSFSFPEEIIVCPNLIETLDKRQIRSGGTEALKHALITDDFILFSKLSKALLSCDLEALKKEIPYLLSIKEHVVQEDPFESSYRMILNLGHTLGHSLEALSQEHHKKNPHKVISHGEAVALGLCFILLLSSEVDKLDPKKATEYLEKLIESNCLVTRKDFVFHTGLDPLCDKSWNAVEKYLPQDKKQGLASKGFYRWVLMSNEKYYPGCSSYLTEVSSCIAKKVWFRMWTLLENTKSSLEGECHG